MIEISIHNFHLKRNTLQAKKFMEKTFWDGQIRSAGTVYKNHHVCTPNFHCPPVLGVLNAIRLQSSHADPP